MASTQTATPFPVHGGFHYAYLIVFAGIVTTGVPCALVYSCADTFFIPVSGALGVSKAAFSLYFSIANAAMMASLPVAARLMTKMDIRVILGAGTALCGLGLASFSLFDAVWQFYIVGTLMGLGIAPLLYLAVPTLINAWCVKRMGFFVGLCMAFTGIGGVVFNPVGSMLIASGPEGWRTAYLVYGLIILMVALPVVVFVVRGRPEDKGLLPYGADEAAAGGQAVPALRRVPAARALRTSAFLALAWPRCSPPRACARSSSP
ncbi:MAG: MFS transporter [Coriobacteriaceae bacterium]|nr:MFS transporter [Coriobacteriaceae bacterium]